MHDGNPGGASHEQLWSVCPRPSDLEEWRRLSGQQEGEWLSDCSCGCRWFHPLEGLRGADWGVCFNPMSPRAGMVTFEHMGCRGFEEEKDERRD